MGPRRPVGGADEPDLQAISAQELGVSQGQRVRTPPRGAENGGSA